MRDIRKSLKKQLDYARYAHLTIMIFMAVFIFLLTQIPHKWWILSTVVIISSAIEPGLMMQRANARIKGTLLALLCMIPLLYLFQLNYRLIPVMLIFALVCVAASSINQARYDITVFFITIAVFLLTAQNTQSNPLEGPMEMILNRGICTIIGILIIITGDYFLFNSYQYSKKLHLFNQLNVYVCLKEGVHLLRTQSRKESASLQFMNKMRDEFNDVYNKVSLSANSLQADVQADPRIDKLVISFQQTIWELRRVHFALISAVIVLQNEDIIHHHLQEHYQLMKQARNEFISNTSY